MHKMLLSHDPENGVWGDCHRTALAAVFGLHPSEVPHFYEKGPARPPLDVEADINAWLGERYGLRQIHIAYPGETNLGDVLAAVGCCNPGVTYLLGATSKFNVGHTVVCRDAKIIFDPSPVDSGAAGPMEDGFWWVTFLGRAG